MRTCTDCDRPMRTRGQPATYGLVLHQARGLCSACYEARRRPPTAPTARPRPVLDAAARAERTRADAAREERRAAHLAKTIAARRRRLDGLDTPTPIEPGWQDRAACIELGPHVFETITLTDEARTFCTTKCPVARSCLEAAMVEEGSHPATYRSGIRGGLTPKDRAHLTRRRRDQRKDAA